MGKVKGILLVFLVGFIFSGCLGLSPQEQKARYEKHSSDQYLSNIFSKFYEDGRFSVNSNNNGIFMIRRVVDYDDKLNNSQTTFHIQKYFVGDEVFNLYKKAITQRGNIYKTYTGSMNKKLQSIYMGGNLASFNKVTSRFYIWDLLPTIAEFNEDGKLISIMLNRVEKGVMFNHFNQPQAPATLFLATNLLYGVELNPFKYSVSKHSWDTNIIQTSKNQ